MRMPTTRHPEYISDPNNNPEKNKTAVPELTIGTPPEQAHPASPETPIAPPSPAPEAQVIPQVPAPEAGAAPVVDATQAEAQVGNPPVEEVTLNSSGHPPTMADKRSALAEPNPPAAAETNANIAAAPEEKSENVGWFKRLFGGKKHEPETPLVITGALPRAEDTEVTNPARRRDDLEARKESGQIFVPASDRYSVGSRPTAEQPPQNPSPNPEENQHDQAA